MKTDNKYQIISNTKLEPLTSKNRKTMEYSKLQNILLSSKLKYISNERLFFVVNDKFSSLKYNTQRNNF